jgi:hypothetical protein
VSQAPRLLNPDWPQLKPNSGFVVLCFVVQVQAASARPAGSPRVLVLQVDQVELLDTFASAVDAVWVEIDLEAAPHLLSASARHAVLPMQKAIPPAKVVVRVDHAVSLAVTAEELRREQEEDAINERFPTAPAWPASSPPLLALLPPSPRDGDARAPLPPLASDMTEVRHGAVLAAAVMPRQHDPEAPPLQELLEAMLKRQESSLVTVVVKGSKVGMKLRGMEKDAEVEIGYCQVDLLELLDGGGNLYGEWLELRSPALRASASASEMAHKIGRVQVGMQATHALRMVSHVAKKAYMDAFKLVVFGGVTAGDPPLASGAEQVRARWVTLRARWVTLRARWVTLRARWVTLRARWVTLRARWVTLRARWVTLRARWVTLRARWVTQRAR